MTREKRVRILQHFSTRILLITSFWTRRLDKEKHVTFCFTHKHKTSKKKWMRGFFCARKKPGVAKHYGCKRARYCGLIANGLSQANRDFSSVRNMNCCSARFARWAAIEFLIHGHPTGSHCLGVAINAHELMCSTRSHGREKRLFSVRVVPWDNL